MPYVAGMNEGKIREPAVKRILIWGDSFATGFAYAEDLKGEKPVKPFGEYLKGKRFGYHVDIKGKEGLTLGGIASQTAEFQVRDEEKYDFIFVIGRANNALFNLGFTESKSVDERMTVINNDICKITNNLSAALKPGACVHYLPVYPLYQAPYFKYKTDERAIYTGPGNLVRAEQLASNIMNINQMLLEHAAKNDQAIYLIDFESISSEVVDESVSKVLHMYAADKIHPSSVAHQILAHDLNRLVIDPEPLRVYEYHNITGR